MSVQLLDKTRKINNLLHNNNSHKVVFNDICEVLSEILESDVLETTLCELLLCNRLGTRYQESRRYC